MRIGQRHTQQGIGTELALVGRAIQGNQLFIQTALVVGIETRERRGNARVDVGHRVAHTLAEIARLVAITQFDGFA
jgi:hypothetical protein